MEIKVCIDGIWYKLNKENKTASVTRSDDKEEKVVIPEVVVYEGEEYSVTGIGLFAFYGCSTLTSITIPESVKVIGTDAFSSCCKLKSIAIPKSVEEVGIEAFTDTAWYINQPDGIMYIGKVLYEYKGKMPENSTIEIKDGTICIGNGAFSNCSGLTSIIIPESVKNIEGWAFEGCSGLTSITIPNFVTKIGRSAFRSCSGLTSITIPESVEEIESWAFSDCSGLKSIIVADNNTIYDSRNNCNAIIETNTNTLIAGCATTIIPESVTEIGSRAFSGCSGLTTIIIPESVTEIGDDAFSDCSGLTSITIPESVTEIGNWAFSGCSSLTTITIPESVEEIEFGAFWGCSGLTSITIPESVTEIGDSAFFDCSGLTTIIIPESVTKIKGCAFIHCSGLSSIIIPDSVTKIEECTFSGCSGLASITIPENVNEIEERAFIGCSGLKSIIVAEKNVIYDSRNSCNAIIETNSNTLIAGCATTIIPASVTRIGGCAFIGCSGLKSITIPENVTEIGDDAFSYCSGLTSITIPESVMKIGSHAFWGCSNLKEIYCYNFLENWNDAFDESLVGDITLHVPKHALDYVLNSFKKIVPIEAKVKKIELPTKILLSEKSVHLLDQTITPSYATEQRLSWKSSNEEVAVVNSKGRVVALSSGTATITAMATDDSEVSASCEIVVRRMVESIQLNQTSVKLVAGNTFPLSALVTPKDAYDTSLTWSTTDDDIAMILGNGRVVAVSAGTATITAEANDGSGVSATCEVVVTENNIQV